MKRLLLLLIATVAMKAATAVAPPEAFVAAGYDPTTVSGGINGQNADFFLGFQVGETTPIVSPDNCAFPDWWTYIATVRKTELPRYKMPPFFIINYNVGVDSAKEVAAHYFFYHDPTAGGVVDCSASASARVKRVKQPTVKRHVDLTEKGAKAVIKVVYQGARVIL